jgi:hypothetical protein
MPFGMDRYGDLSSLATLNITLSMPLETVTAGRDAGSTVDDETPLGSRPRPHNLWIIK